MYKKDYTVTYKKYNEPVRQLFFTTEQTEEMIELIFKLTHDNTVEFIKKVTTEFYSQK